MVMDDDVCWPILRGGGGVLIIIKDSLNAFPIQCPGDLVSFWLESVCET